MTETTRSDHPRVWWKEIPKRWLLRTFFDFAVCGGEPHARYLRTLGFGDTRIARCYDVVDNEFYAEASREARKQPELRKWFKLPEHFFLYVGRLAREKNVHGLIDAFAGYRARGGEWSLVIVGDGPEGENLKRQCVERGVAGPVMFAGLKKTPEIAIYYAFARCFVLPSVREPWGLVVNEAMAAGLPVIVSDRCGCAEDLVRHGENGYLFDPSQPGDLEGRLCAMGQSPELDRMTARSSELIRSFSLERWADEVARVAGVSGPVPVR